MSARTWKIAAGFLAVALLGGGVVLATQPVARFMIMGPPRASASFARAATSAIPFEFFREARIFVPVSVNGRPSEAMLDSGAGMTVISSELAARLGIASEGQMTVHTQNGPQQAGIATGATIEVGGLTLSGVGLLVMDLSGLGPRVGRSVPIILGRDAFEAGIVEIDFAGRAIRFSDPGAFRASPTAVRLPLVPTGHSGTREISLSINGLPPVEAAFDLGSGGAIIVSHDYTVTRNLLAGVRTSETLAGGTTSLTRRTIATLRSVSLAGQTFRNVPASFNGSDSELPASGVNVGVDLLSRFRLAVDYSHDALYLAPDPAAIARPLSRDRAGLRYELRPDRLVVTFISPGSPAAGGGFRAGDEIVSIDGQPIDRDFFRGPTGGWALGAPGTHHMLQSADGRRRELVLADYY